MAKEVKCFAAYEAKGEIKPWKINRRSVGPKDVGFDIKWCGICHSDIHQARGEWGPADYPMVPGHEITGIVTEVGKEVKLFKKGDAVGVGCFVDSCRNCVKCREGRENYCRGGGLVLSYNAKYKYPHCGEEYTSDGGKSVYGGYSQYMVVDESYVLRIPGNIDLAAAAPLLCAGITMWSPMMHFGVQAKSKIGVAGLGGLGHMAVKFGVAMGAHVTVLSRSEGKREECLKHLGAHAFVNCTKQDQVDAVAESFDIILDTIAAEHDIGQLVAMLSGDGGNLVMLGISQLSIHAFPLVAGRKQISGSMIGGIRETQEMLDFCGRHNIVCDIEKIKADQINVAYERTIKSDVKYRFVVDISTI